MHSDYRASEQTISRKSFRMREKADLNNIRATNQRGIRESFANSTNKNVCFWAIAQTDCRVRRRLVVENE